MNYRALLTGAVALALMPALVAATPAPTPTFYPAAGTYTSVQTVYIHMNGADHTYYTTDGTTPTTNSTPYVAGTPITVGTTTTIQAVSTEAGYSTSAIGSATFTINLAPAATPTFSVAAGTYTSAQTVYIQNHASGGQIYYTADGTTPTTSSTAYVGGTPLTVSTTTTIKAICTAPGYSTSAVASATYTINLAPAATPTFSVAGGTYTSIQTVYIQNHASGGQIYYTTDGTTPTTSSTVYVGGTPLTVSTTTTINAICTAPGYSTSAVASATYSINLPPAPTPTFSLAAGTYTSTQTIYIYKNGATSTYYTLDGTAPTTNSAQYVAGTPITLATTTTIRAISTEAGYSTSAVGSATYTITPPAALPQLSPTAGTYQGTYPLTVSISDATPGAQVYYTTNGTTPTTGSTPYTGPFALSSTATVQAIATAPGYTSSPVGSAAYTIIPPVATPTFSVTPGTYVGPVSLTVYVFDATSNAQIYFTTDGSTPTAGSTQYGGPVLVNVTTTIQAIATASGYATSPVAIANYSIVTPASLPSFNPPAGTYSSAQTVSIFDVINGAQIYYTTDGSTPTTSSTPYTGPITISTTTTIQAIAAAAGDSSSEVAVATFTITAPGSSSPGEGAQYTYDPAGNLVQIAPAGGQ